MRIHFYCFRKFGSNKKEHLIFNSNAGLLEYRNRQVVYYTLYSYGFSQMRMLEIYDIINVIVTVERQHKIVKILDLWISSSEWIYSSATVISSFFSILFGVTMYIPFIEINRCLRSCFCITQSVLHYNLLVFVCFLAVMRVWRGRRIVRGERGQPLLVEYRWMSGNSLLSLLAQEPYLYPTNKT